MSKPGILDHLREGGVIVGDGSTMITLERRGYILAGPYVPEVVISKPEVVEQLARDFAHCGAQVIQACTFAATEDKLMKHAISENLSHEQLVIRAVEIAKRAASPVDAYVCGGMSSTPTFRSGANVEDVKKEFRKMAELLFKNDVDFLLGEFFHCVEEAVLCVEVMKEVSNGTKPVAVTMLIGPSGDESDVSPQECAVRLVRAGADIVGVNCGFDPETSLETISMMKDGLTEAGLAAFLMTQPCGYHCQESRNLKGGIYNLPEFPYAIEPRMVTRLDCYDYARKAYDLGVRYIGGCCGFEPIHIRAIAQELQKETGRDFPGSKYASKWGDSFLPCFEHRGSKEHWVGLIPGVGRSKIQTFSEPDTKLKLT